MKNYLKQSVCRSLGWALLVGVACLTGCSTTDQADSGDMASMKISGHTDAEIQQAASGAFLSNGYQKIDRLTFEKQGTSWDKMAYGGWSPNPVWIRIRINITSAGAGQSILACDAYAVVDRNEASMEEEKKLSVSYRSECKKILDQARARLDSPPGGGAQ
jgi:hypothetical protein